ncbi:MULTISPECIES: hypothetical protein [Bacillaceae]|jgi:hypothetical protein|uniref:Uncharacterized protein n=2 Tax=Niallia TaxID=2837506 RepID=A0A7Y0KC61_9BACI|nr:MULTISPECIES: hypothetical protein [Bacillaceae]MCF2650546.1 hypothetical protein [Niallia circulans]MCM3363568.1 hypothetical protein [Niallia sp. MER TA 168]NMO79567.1 hypothetical protein [Niallia alba]
MPHWTPIKNEPFINIMDDYRREIENKDAKATKEITRQYAHRLYQEYEILSEHTENAVYEHLSYFDDLLAGISNMKHAKKDIGYYGNFPRTFNKNKLNLARVMRSR